MVQNPGSHPYHTMAQASVPYYGTRSVPYPRKGMVQTSVPYYGTSAVPYPTTSFSIPAAISRAIPSQSRAIPVPYLGHIDKCRAHSFPSREPYPCHTRAIPQGVQEQSRQDSPAPEATTNPSKQQTAGETVKPGAGQDSPGAEQDSRGAVPYISICAGMEQAPVPYSGTRPVPYPSQGMAQAPVPYYGTAACQKSSPGKRGKNSLPYVGRVNNL